MPRKPLPVDWDAIRSLYLQGVEPIEIANRFCIHLSTLQSKIYRKKWNLIKSNGKQTIAKVQEKGAEIARDIWAERRETIRENIHTIGHKMTAYAAQMPEDQLLAKADKVKIAAEIASKIVGLDKDEDKNQVNIAILGAIGSGPGAYDDLPRIIEPTQSDTKQLVYSVEDTDTESVDPTTQPTTVPLDPPRALYDNINNGF